MINQLYENIKNNINLIFNLLCLNLKLSHPNFLLITSRYNNFRRAFFVEVKILCRLLYHIIFQFLTSIITSCFYFIQIFEYCNYLKGELDNFITIRQLIIEQLNN